MENNLSEKVTLTRYDLEEAKACIAYYKFRAQKKGIAKNNLIKAYLLRTEDIFEALGIVFQQPPSMSYARVRVYLGMLQTTTDTDTVYKLFLVPVDSSGKDVILNGPITSGGPNVDYVFDFNTPCPNTCDKTSPLFLAGE